MDMIEMDELQIALAAIPDADLIKRAVSALARLCETGGKSFVVRIPAQIGDTDMVFCEVIRRYSDMVRRYKPVVVGEVIQSQSLYEADPVVVGEVIQSQSLYEADEDDL